MKSIKIQPQNIPKYDHFIMIELNENDLFYGKAKRLISGIFYYNEEKIKGIPQDEFVFFSKNKSMIIHDDDRVIKLLLRNEPIEIDLYVTSDLVKNLLLVQKDSKNLQQINRSIGFEDMDKTEKLQVEIQKIKQEFVKQENQRKAEVATLNQTIEDFKQKINNLQTTIQQNKEQYQNRFKFEEEQKLNHLEKFKAETIITKNLKIQLMQEEQKSQNLQEKMNEQEKEMKLVRKLQEESKIIRSQQKNQITDQQLQNLKFQLESVERNYQEEQSLRKKEIEKNKQLNYSVNDLQSKIDQRTDELNMARCQAEIEQQQLQTQLKNQEQKYQNLLNNNEYLKKQTLSAENYTYQLSAELDRANEQVRDLRMKTNNLELEIQQKEYMINEIRIQKDKQISSIANKDESKLQEILNYYQIKEKKMMQKIEEQEMSIADLNNEICSLKYTLQKQQKEFQESSKQLLSKLEQETENAREIEKKRILLLNRIKLKNAKKVGDGKIYSPTEALKSNKAKNPFDFLKDPNTISNDIQVQVQEITIDFNKALENLIKNQDPDISKFISYQPLGKWGGKRNINNNGEGTRRKCYLFQVLNSDGNHYNNDVYMIKELIGHEKITTVEEALTVAQNNSMAKALAIHFQNELSKRNNKLVCKFQFPKQYLLLSNGNYYIAEKLKQGEFVKFNGEGNTPDKNSEITAFLNAFSIFTYNITQKQFMVTNLQGIIGKKEIILYDPIVSSHEGILSEEDLAEPHILQFLTKYKENPKKYGQVYLDQLTVQK